jgi:hypothetical protein
MRDESWDGSTEGAGSEPSPDPLSDEDWAARLACSGDDEEPVDPELEEDLYSGAR